MNCARHLSPFTLQPIECALQQERLEPENARLPILMLSAKAREVDIYTGRRVGADIYVTKPMDLSALVVQMGTFLEGERQDA